MPEYEGFPPGEVEDLKGVCVDALFGGSAALAGTRAFSRAIMRAGWRRRPEFRLRESPVSEWRPAGSERTGWLEMLDADGVVEWSFRVPPMAADDWARLSARLTP